MAKYDVIIHRLGDIDDKLGDINSHLKQLNGSVARHEAFYQRQSVFNKIGGWGGSVLVVAVLSILFKVVLG